MTTLSYTATKNLVASGISISANDISILASDDSFNSAGGGFLGLLDGEWILASGSAVDDGWHQLNGDSTAAKIITLSALTDEVAGSLIDIVGYKHGINQTYNLETQSHNINQSFKGTSSKAESLNGNVETLFMRDTEFWTILTDILSETELAYWVEFMASTKAGETFTFDAYGTIASPDNVISCILDGDPTIIRIEGTRSYQVAFKVRAI